MGHIHPSLGFTPRSTEEILKALRTEWENTLGISYQSDQEFQDTNLYRLFLGFCTTLSSLEDDAVRIIDRFMTWIRETGGAIAIAQSGTYAGVTQAFLEVFKGVKIDSGNTNEKIPPGIALVALDNTDDEDQVPTEALTEKQKTALAQIFEKMWPAGILTHYSFSDPQDNADKLYEVHVPSGDHDTQIYTVALVNPHPLEICIHYRPLFRATIPVSEEKALKEAFLESFGQSHAIGQDFDPGRYISNATVPWVAEALCAWKEVGSTQDFSFQRYSIPHYFEKFTLARDKETQVPLISVKLL